LREFITSSKILHSEIIVALLGRLYI